MHLKLFFHTALLFLAGQGLALLVAEQLYILAFPSSQSGSGISLVTFLILFFSATLFLLVLLALHRGVWLFRTIFFLMLFVGLLKMFELVFPTSLSIIISLFFIAGLYLLPMVWSHDAVVLLAGAGIGPIFGLQFSWEAALLLLAILSVYDIIAVFGTHHMVRLAHELMRRQATFALIVPERFADFRSSLSHVQPGSGFLIIGGGDIVLPMILSTSLFVVARPLAYAAIAGMTVGLFVNHIWLVRSRKPLPALPFIALGAALGIALGSALYV
jgi:presenilin-like A22 family membrane protease